MLPSICDVKLATAGEISARAPPSRVRHSQRECGVFRTISRLPSSVSSAGRRRIGRLHVVVTPAPLAFWRVSLGWAQSLLRLGCARVPHMSSRLIPSDSSMSRKMDDSVQPTLKRRTKRGIASAGTSVFRPDHEGKLIEHVQRRCRPTSAGTTTVQRDVGRGNPAPPLACGRVRVGATKLVDGPQRSPARGGCGTSGPDQPSGRPYRALVPTENLRAIEGDQAACRLTRRSRSRGGADPAVPITWPPEPDPFVVLLSALRQR